MTRHTRSGAPSRLTRNGRALAKAMTDQYKKGKPDDLNAQPSEARGRRKKKVSAPAPAPRACAGTEAGRLLFSASFGRRVDCGLEFEDGLFSAPRAKRRLLALWMRRPNRDVARREKKAMACIPAAC